MDDDANADNGIQVIAGVRDLAAGENIDFNQTSTAFTDDGNVQSVVATLTTVTSAGVRVLVDDIIDPPSSGESTLTLSGDDTSVFGTELVLDGFVYRLDSLGSRNLLAATQNARIVEGDLVVDAVMNVFDFSDTAAGISMRINRDGNSYLYAVTATNCEAVGSDLECDAIVFDVPNRIVTITDAVVAPAFSNQETAPLTINGVLQWSTEDETN